jgi:uncharacterized protein YPO0396
MTIMQQMNLFNTSSEVAGFKLDYLEVWNWGTFDKKGKHSASCVFLSKL